MANFKIGDIVALKSGSEAMTVADAVGSAVTCRWQNPVSGRFEEESFRPDMLQPARMHVHQSRLRQLFALRPAVRAAVEASKRNRGATAHEVELGSAGSPRQST